MKSRGCDCPENVEIADTAAYYRQSRSHHRVPSYCREWIGKKRLAMILFLVLSAKGERRVSSDLKARVGDDGK
jgi:hypothetical protein